MTVDARPRRRAGRPRRSEGDKDVRHEILVAASHLFCKNGYTGTQLNQIADAAGLRTPSLYHYFSNKEEIFQELFRYANEDATKFAASTLKQKGRAAVRLRSVLVKYVEWLTSGPYALWFLVVSAPRNVVNDVTLERRYVLLENAIDKLVKQAIKEGDFRPVDRRFALHMIWGGVVGAMNYYQLEGVAAPHLTADHIISALSINSAKAQEILEESRA